MKLNLLSMVALLAVQVLHPLPAKAANTPPKPFMTLQQVVDVYGKPARTKLEAAFRAADVPYPPKTSTWVALKEEKVLYVFAPGQNGKMQRVLSFPIIGASGVAGPKLREGDKQVPEGFYKFVRFRPNLVAHIGMEVNYPNEEDRLHAKQAKRTNLGSDIIIHGSRWSTGCLAMENAPIEQLFTLAYDSGLDSVNLIFAPCDLTRTRPNVRFDQQPAWLPKLYERIHTSLKALPL